MNPLPYKVFTQHKGFEDGGFISPVEVHADSAHAAATRRFNMLAETSDCTALLVVRNHTARVFAVEVAPRVSTETLKVSA